MITISLHDKSFSEFCFRLLNSEIGNDPEENKMKLVEELSFRLLNSEIGNDLDNPPDYFSSYCKFSSP